MNEKQFSQLMDEVGGIKTEVSTLGTKFNELETKVEKFSKPTEEETPKGEEQPNGDETPKDNESGDSSEQFNKLLEEISSVKTELGTMKNKFNQLNKEVDGQEPDPEGKGHSFSVV